LTSFYVPNSNCNKLFKIINCDKNVGNAIISNDLYDESVLNYLNFNEIFIPITSNPLEETVNYINKEIENLFNNGHISNELGKKLKSNTDSKLGSFRLLAKLHKTKFNWRPIINCKNHPNSKITKFLDILIKPIVSKTESYIKDSQNLIQLTKDIKFTKKPYIISLDYDNLYLSINPVHATKLITEFMNHILNNQHINIVAFNKLLKLMFNTNFFKYKNSFYQQIKGIAMGSIAGPSIANIYIYILEIKWLYIHRASIYIYKRFIDDILMVLKSELDFKEFEKNFIYLKLTKSTGDKVNFLKI